MYPIKGVGPSKKTVTSQVTMKPMRVIVPATHFVGFTPVQMFRWTCVFGKPMFVHQKWDKRAEQEYAEGDTIIYANGTPERIQDHPEYKERNMR